MPTLEFHPSLDHPRRVLATGFVGAVLDAADPARALKARFDARVFTRPAHILSFGKASIEMTHAGIELLGDRFARATVLATENHIAQSQFKGKHIDLFVADHPLPTERSVDATRGLLEHARSIPVDHQVMVLISGGGSSMLCAPAGGVSIEEIARQTKALLNAGASIQEINKVRSQLDTIKAGGLAEYLAHVARIDAYALCDVIDPDETIRARTIASGPVAIPGVEHTIIADNQSAVDAACAWVAHEHIEMIDIQRQVVGAVGDCARLLVERICSSEPAAHPRAVCLGGEPTVDLQGQNGEGGPMLELALACAEQLGDAPFRWTIMTFATDGVDGPTAAAGALLTDDMLAGIDPESIRSALDSHDSLRMCDRLGGTIRTGVTGTNVNDVAIVIRWEDA
jgi:glycerate 2-kinase